MYIRNTDKLMKTFVNRTAIQCNYLCRALRQGCNVGFIVKSNYNLHFNPYDSMQNIFLTFPPPSKI